MKLRDALLLGALALGLACGPSALESAAASMPPIRREDLSFLFFGSAVAGLFVPGLQVLRADARYGRFAIRFFALMSVWSVGTGSSALITATIRGDVQADAFVLLCSAMVYRPACTLATLCIGGASEMHFNLSIAADSQQQNAAAPQVVVRQSSSH